MKRLLATKYGKLGCMGPIKENQLILHISWLEISPDTIDGKTGPSSITCFLF